MHQENVSDEPGPRYGSDILDQGFLVHMYSIYYPPRVFLRIESLKIFVDRTSALHIAAINKP